jgi:hypothetical protein
LFGLRKKFQHLATFSLLVHSDGYEAYLPREEDLRMKTPCERCKGNGSLYTSIAGDVHIADCPECEGFGTVKAAPPAPKKQKEPPPYKSFGAINIDELLADTSLGRE